MRTSRCSGSKRRIDKLVSECPNLRVLLSSRRSIGILRAAKAKVLEPERLSADEAREVVAVRPVTTICTSWSTRTAPPPIPRAGWYGCVMEVLECRPAEMYPWRP